ncbi:TerC/Alx family metal homeostasis membrane protein [Flavobacterium jejuense]|uniref:TerC/Alx family metal homeostasis membrane protein n=1 Tax=Flavobacterium jejuense TaxID=1544455 RepID=A0ABX0ISI5_9FLAO|nr:TerC/Alx family metal homeostasis membrane protein [Flavobacterium jejuense]NHN25453.1 TerC/Alx family metal homeostasis membrane protein [Flavobacterium jejuense]
MDSLINHPVILSVFTVVIIGMLLLDLGILNKKSHAITSREAAYWSILWISLSMGFSSIIYYYLGFEKFSQFQGAYWIEKALSVDNLFVFILVFGYFNVGKELQHKVLFWGVIGALVFRAIFIFSGVWILNYTYLPEMILFGKEVTINYLLTIFGLILIVAGFKSWFSDNADDGEKDFSKSPGARLVHKFFKVSPKFDEDHFFTIQNGVKMATPLLVVITIIEFTDLLFAVDSIPAIFAIAPDDPFILYTSNIFAILGLRSLYFLLANFMYMFSRLHYGLALILGFIGIKMIIAPFVHISSLVSLGVVGSVLLISVIWSILSPVKD